MDVVSKIKSEFLEFGLLSRNVQKKTWKEMQNCNISWATGTYTVNEVFILIAFLKSHCQL